MSSTEKDGGETEGEGGREGGADFIWGAVDEGARDGAVGFAERGKKPFDRGRARGSRAFVSEDTCRDRRLVAGLAGSARALARAAHFSPALASARLLMRAVEALASETRRGGGGGGRGRTRGWGGRSRQQFPTLAVRHTWLSLRGGRNCCLVARRSRRICGRPGSTGSRTHVSVALMGLATPRRRGVRRRPRGCRPARSSRAGGGESGVRARSARPPASGGKATRRLGCRACVGGGGGEGEATHGQRRDVHLAAARRQAARPPDRKRLRVRVARFPSSVRPTRPSRSRRGAAPSSPSRERRRPHSRTTRRPRLALRPRRGSTPRARERDRSLAPTPSPSPRPRPRSPRRRAGECGRRRGATRSEGGDKKTETPRARSASRRSRGGLRVCEPSKRARLHDTSA